MPQEVIIPLTDTERTDIEYHLGWLLFQQPLLVNGRMTEHQVLSLLRNTINHTEASGVYRIREALCELQKCLDQKKALRGKAGIKRVGDVEIDVDAGLRTIDEEYKAWANKLADIYGGHKNLYSMFHAQIGSTSNTLQESF